MCSQENITSNLSLKSSHLSQGCSQVEVSYTNSAAANDLSSQLTSSNSKVVSFQYILDRALFPINLSIKHLV